jgi:DNA-binding winged helix-turn-helix (wHTH) protein
MRNHVRNYAERLRKFQVFCGKNHTRFYLADHMPRGLIMKTVRDVTYQLVRELGPVSGRSPAPAFLSRHVQKSKGEASMGSRITNPTTAEVLEELKVRPVAERARIVGRAGEIFRAKREDRDDEGVDFGRYRIFPRLRLLLRDGVKVDIVTRAFDVLWVLVQADGELVSKDQLLDTVWSGVVVEENNLQAQMSALRRALGADRGMIRTEFGLGYRLVAEKQKTARSDAGTSEVKRLTPSSLPLPLTSLLGRAADDREIERLFHKSRLGSTVSSGRRQLRASRWRFRDG